LSENVTRDEDVEEREMVGVMGKLMLENAN
jgi:hypothetical protein